MNNRIYLLTGAAGLLGSNVSRQLIDRGEQVRALVLNGDPAVKYIPEEVELVSGDVTDTESLQKFLQYLKAQISMLSIVQVSLHWIQTLMGRFMP